MNLHNDEELFNQVIDFTAEYLNISRIYVEKDYWVTLVLKSISQSTYFENIIFKGGKFLLKTYKIIDRFSEDIDLAIINSGKSSNQMKQLIKLIEKDILCKEFVEIRRF